MGMSSVNSVARAARVALPVIERSQGDLEEKIGSVVSTNLSSLEQKDSGRSRSSSPVEVLQNQLEAFFEQVALRQAPLQEPTCLIDVEWVEGYKREIETLSNRVNAITSELDNKSVPNKSRRQKLKKQLVTHEAKVTLLQNIVDIYEGVIKQSDGSKNLQEIHDGILPLILNSQASPSKEESLIIAGMCVAFLMCHNAQRVKNTVGIENAYQLLLTLSVDPKKGKQMGKYLREASYCLACDQHYDMAAQLFQRGQRDFKPDEECMAVTLSNTFIRYGKVLGCDTTKAALAAVNKFSSVTGTKPQYTKDFSEAVRIGQGWVEYQLTQALDTTVAGPHPEESI